jgi:hypothetical protein
VDDACIETFLKSFGRRLFRRPLSAEELADYQAVISDTARGDIRRGLRMALYALLQSPQFLYRTEQGIADPDKPGRRIYTSYEMAQRLSFLLWETTPDDELLDAAQRGELDTQDGIYLAATRLLESERARVATQSFFAQFLNLHDLEGLERDIELYPEFTDTLVEAMNSEVRLLVDDIVFRRNADMREIFSGRRIFVNQELAEFYGIDAPEASPVAFVPVELPDDSPRSGFLTSGAFLSMNAHQTDTSPTLRGKYLRERVLCQRVPPPPPEVDTTIKQPDEEAKTLRQRLERHRTDPLCAGCHSFTDPPGYLFENFDSLGRYRTEDNGEPVDASGDLDGVPLASVRDLAEVLATDERVGACMVKQLFRHANGRLDLDGEEPVLDALTAKFADSGYRFQELLLELAISDGFRTAISEEDSP